MMTNSKFTANIVIYPTKVRVFGKIMNLARIKKLRIPVEQLEGGAVVKIDFNLSSKNKVEIPSGNEWATNSKCLPGGKLPSYTSIPYQWYLQSQMITYTLKGINVIANSYIIP